MKTLTIRVAGDQIRQGDVMRFRMSKHDPVRWLTVIRVTPSGKRVSVGLEGGAVDLVSIRNKSDWRVVRRATA
jgi:hypothetical protein